MKQTFPSTVSRLSDAQLITALDKMQSLESDALVPKNHYNKTLVKVGHALLKNDPDGERALDPFISCYEKTGISFFDIEKEYDEKISIRRVKKAYHKNTLSFVHYNKHLLPAAVSVTAAIAFRNLVPHPEAYSALCFATIIGSYAVASYACVKSLSTCSSKTQKEFSEAQLDLLEFQQKIKAETPQFPAVINAYNALNDKNHYLIKDDPKAISMAYDMVIELSKRRSTLRL